MDGNGEVRGAQTKPVTLPTGRVVVIRRPGPRQFRDIYAGLPIVGRPSEMLVDMPLSALIDLNIRMVCACSVEPKFADCETSNGVLSVDDLHQSDFNALTKAINDFAGNAEAEEKLGGSTATEERSSS